MWVSHVKILFKKSTMCFQTTMITNTNNNIIIWDLRLQKQHEVDGIYVEMKLLWNREKERYRELRSEDEVRRSPKWVWSHSSSCYEFLVTARLVMSSKLVLLWEALIIHSVSTGEEKGQREYTVMCQNTHSHVPDEVNKNKQVHMRVNMWLCPLPISRHSQGRLGGSASQPNKQNNTSQHQRQCNHHYHQKHRQTYVMLHTHTHTHIQIHWKQLVLMQHVHY